jgi:predicted esterase
MQTRHVSTQTHGRFLYEARDPARLLVGFHGYAQTAEAHMKELLQIPGQEAWSLSAVQALHPFYVKNYGEVAASWMTSQDRELAIADNIDYVRRVVATLPRPEKLVFLGFSQGTAMAFRAAADFGWRCHGVVALAADVPPDVAAQEGVHLPPTFLARGKRDEWYTEEKFEKDLKFLRRATNLTTCVFDGAHEWTDELRDAVGAFLRRIVL